MSETFLQKITERRRIDVAALKAATDMTSLKSAAENMRSTRQDHLFSSALARPDGINIIAEIKRASPSKGVINANVDVARRGKQYESGGAAAISVLTEPRYFMGSLDDLRAVRSAVRLPVLRKDFFVDEFQIYEAAAAGADAILLIVPALTVDELRDLRHLAEDQLGLDALVEVHTQEELDIARRIGARIIGVNNRDLHTLSVSLDTSRELIKYKPDRVLMIAESGLSSREEIVELRSLGFDGFLVGESLMRVDDAAATLEAWV